MRFQKNSLFVSSNRRQNNEAKLIKNQIVQIHSVVNHSYASCVRLESELSERGGQQWSSTNRNQKVVHGGRQTSGGRAVSKLLYRPSTRRFIAFTRRAKAVLRLIARSEWQRVARVASNSIRKFISPISLKTFYFCCARNCIAFSCSHSILLRGSFFILNC